MKKILFSSTIAIFALVAFSFKSSAPENILIQKGSVLVYDINTTNSSYTITTTVMGTAEELHLHLSFTDAAKTETDLIMNAASLENSHKQLTYFTSGEMKPTDALGVYFSKQMMNELGYGKSYVYLDNNNTPTPLVKLGIEDMPVSINDNILNVSVIHAKEPSYNGKTNLAEYWILNNADCPIILKMKTDFSLQIKGIHL